jgi:signal transduction histidine kinase
MYAEAGDREHLQKETADLGRALYSGAFRIDRATFELYRDMLRDWGGPAPAPTDIARTEAAIGLWQTWRAAELPARGRKIVHPDGTAVLAIWTAGQSGPIAWLASPPEIEAALGPLWNQQRLAAALYDPEGQRLFGPELANAATFTQDETHLPFILRLAFLPGQQDAAGYRTRRRLLIAGLLFAFTLMLAAAYGLYRATAREMALVRQQSDFVSAVSHEFRTPLTSMRHLTELLATNSVPGEERKAQYYALLARETERLHRMVDSLLSFGRMQAGAHAWRLEPADARQLYRRTSRRHCSAPSSGAPKRSVRGSAASA